MSAEIIKLEIDNDPREVISILTELLDRAKNGEFESFIGVCLRTDRTFFTKSSRYKNSLEMIGALHTAIHDVVEASEK